LITQYDAIEDLKLMLAGGWDSNAGGEKPDFQAIWDKKVSGLGGDFRDMVLIQPRKEKITQFALFAQAFWHEAPISIDVRTYSGIKRHNATVKEIVRILKNNVRRSAQGFIDVLIDGVDSYNKDYRNIYRAVIDIRYRDVTDTVS